MRFLSSLLLAIGLSCASLAGPAVAQSFKVASGQVWPAPVAPSFTAPGVNGVARLTKDAADIGVGPFIAIGAKTAVEADAGVDVRGGRFAGITGRDLGRFGIRLRNAYDVTISGFDLTHAAEPSTGVDLPGGIVIGGGDRITIADGAISGFRMAVLKGVYTNGDGIAIEDGATNVTIRNVAASDNSDGGFDLKLGDGSRLDELTAERNGRGFRFWYQADAGVLTARDNTSAVWLAKGAVATIGRLVASSAVPAQVFTLEGSTVLTVLACDLTGMAKGSTLIKSNGSGNKVVLGPTCKL